MLRLLRSLLLTLLLLTTLASGQSSGRRVALLVGNQAYATGGLRFPSQDVAQLRGALQGIGFASADIAVVADADQKRLRRALAEFGERARGAEVAFFYYSGHATQARGQNWLVPIGADIRKEADYELEAVSAQAALTQLQEAAPRLSVVVLDACRDNPVAFSRSGTKGLARMEAGAATVLAFATAPNTTAADNGLYARTLAAELRRPGVEILDVFRNTGAVVRAATRGEQAPRVGEVDLPTRFYLAGLQPESVPNPVVAPVAPSAVTGLDLGDLQREVDARAAREREQVDRAARVQADFDRVKGLASGDPRLGVQAWERFLGAYDRADTAASAATLAAARVALAEARDSLAQPLNWAQAPEAVRKYKPPTWEQLKAWFGLKDDEWDHMQRYVAAVGDARRSRKFGFEFVSDFGGYRSTKMAYFFPLRADCHIKLTDRMWEVLRCGGVSRLRADGKPSEAFSWITELRDPDVDELADGARQRTLQQMLEKGTPTSRADTVCVTGAAVAASALDPRLPGRAWPRRCDVDRSSLKGDGRKGKDSFVTYYLEGLGVDLSEMAEGLVGDARSEPATPRPPGTNLVFFLPNEGQRQFMTSDLVGIYSGVKWFAPRDP
jgi:hypothetical protein